MNTYQHKLRYSDLANARPAFQSYLDNGDMTFKRYYSSQDVSIYFDNCFIDNAHYIEFEATESTMLIYGYNSYVFDDIAKGARMIQGRLSINFTQSNYLTTILNDISSHNNTGVLSQSPYQPLWPVGFDLFIHHGSTQANDLQLITLKDIYITGCATQLDARTGEPIAETYTFIGKDISFGTPSNETSTLMSDISDDDVILLTPEIVVDTTTRVLTLDLKQTVVITKATYALNQSPVFYTEGVTCYSDHVTISNALFSQINEDTYITIRLFIEDQEEPFIYETYLL